MGNTITPQDVLDEVIRLGREHPDFRYQKQWNIGDDGDEAEPAGYIEFDNPDYADIGTCTYLPDERNPMGCIVGAALTNLHVLDPDTFDMEGNGAADVVATLLDTWMDSASLSAIATIQFRQDSGLRWGEAIIIEQEDTE